MLCPADPEQEATGGEEPPGRPGLLDARGPEVRWALTVAVGAAVCLWAYGCAKQEPPPGHRPDSRAPAVASISPPPGSIVRDLRAPLVIRFDEPISSTRGLETQLKASPGYRYRVSSGHTAIRIRPDGGWRPGAVYRIVLPANLSDILGNRRRDSIEVRFSTGPPVPATEVTGKIWDRVTGVGTQGARALFLAASGDSIPYTAVAGQDGRFRLPAVPPGTYRAFGFMDNNRNRQPDMRLEASDTASFMLEDSTSSVSLDLLLLEPDSTPPLLALVDAPDSVRIRLTFDDHLLPSQELGSDAVTLSNTASGAELPVGEASVLTAAEVERRRPTRVDTAAADTVPSDTTAGGAPAADTAVADTSRNVASATRDTGRQATPSSPAEPLPSQVVELRLGRPIGEGEYRLRIRDVLNLRGLYGSADTTFVYPTGTGDPPDGAGGRAGETGDDTGGDDGV